MAENHEFYNKVRADMHELVELIVLHNKANLSPEGEHDVEMKMIASVVDLLACLVADFHSIAQSLEIIASPPADGTLKSPMPGDWQ